MFTNNCFLLTVNQWWLLSYLIHDSHICTNRLNLCHLPYLREVCGKLSLFCWASWRGTKEPLLKPNTAFTLFVHVNIARLNKLGPFFVLIPGPNIVPLQFIHSIVCTIVFVMLCFVCFYSVMLYCIIVIFQPTCITDFFFLTDFFIWFSWSHIDYSIYQIVWNDQHPRK